jgi:hypothetical protein
MWIRFVNQWKDKEYDFIWFGILIIKNRWKGIELSIGVLGLVIVIEIGE